MLSSSGKTSIYVWTIDLVIFLSLFCERSLFDGMLEVSWLGCSKSHGWRGFCKHIDTCIVLVGNFVKILLLYFRLGLEVTWVDMINHQDMKCFMFNIVDIQMKLKCIMKIEGIVHWWFGSISSWSHSLLWGTEA